MDFHWNWYVPWHCWDLVWDCWCQISLIFDSHLPATRPYFCFQTITWENINGFSPNVVCALDIVGICLGIAIRQIFLTELYVQNTFVFQFPGRNCQWIVTKLGMYKSIVEIRFGIAYWQIFNFDGVICPPHDNGGGIIVSRYVWIHVKMQKAKAKIWSK